MKKRILSLLLTCVLAASLATPAFASKLTFSDVKSNHWAYAAIMDMTERGMFSGTTTPVNGVGTFSPDSVMTRGAFIAVLTRWLFNDELNAMPTGAKWWSNNHTLALNNSILKSGELDNGNLDKAMNRQEMAVVLARIAQGVGLAPDKLVDSSKIPDWNSIGEGYREGVRYSYSLGLIAGTDSKGTFNPKGTLNRAQAATVIFRLLEKISTEKPVWNPGRIDITCDMDAIQGVPSSSIPSGIISAEQWNPENMTKTLAKGEELRAKYGIEGRGSNFAKENIIYFGVVADDGTVQMRSYVDNEGLHFKGYESSPDWQGTACLEYMKTLLSETASTNVSTKAVAMLKDMNDREAKLIAEGEKLGYNEKYDALVDEFDGWMTITSETLWDLGEGCYLSYGPTGYHIYNQWYIDRYDISSLVKPYDSYIFMK